MPFLYIVGKLNPVTPMTGSYRGESGRAGIRRLIKEPIQK